MKKNHLITILVLTLLSCSQTDNKKELIDIATSYVSGQFEEATKSVDDNGIIRIGNRQMGYTIDPSTIIKGMINNDLKEDAIIPVSFYSGPFLQRTEHLFVMNTDEKSGVTKVLDTLMKVLEIRDGIIYAEVSKVAPDSPLYGCSLCKEIVKYRFSNGDIVLAE